VDFFELLTHRCSVRKFTDQPVSREAIDRIVLAANSAPVGSNLYRDLHLTVVRDRDVLHKLGEAARYRLKDKATMRAITKTIPGQEEPKKKDFDPFYGASVVIFVSHRKQDLQPGIEYCNVASVVQTMHLAATELGLSSVFMWGSMEAMRIYPQFDNTDLLHLPENFEPLLALAIGYGEKDIAPRVLNDQKISRNDV